MTAVTSTTIDSFFGRRFKSKIADNSKLTITHSVLCILGLPLLCAIAMILTYMDVNKIKYEDDTLALFAVISVCAIVISVLMGIIIALSSFRYLYNKSLVDMNHSLPLTTKQRFFADYLSGLSVYMIPMLCSVVLGLIIVGIGYMVIGTDETNIFNLVPAAIKAGCIVLVGMILLYTLSVMAVTFCGSLFEAVFSVFTLNAIIPGVIACLGIAVSLAEPFGMGEDAILSKNFFLCTSPIGAAVFAGTYVDGGYFRDIGSESQYISAMYIKWMVITFIVIGLYLAAAFFLYKFRKAEDVSKPYVYPWFYYVFMFSAVLCVISLFFMFEESIAGAILICAIGWFIMEVIRRRGFKKFWTAGISFAASLAVAFGICFLCKASKGFGAYKYVPSAGNVEMAELYIGGMSSVSSYDCVFKSKEVIESITALQKEVISLHENPDNIKQIPVTDPNSLNDELTVTVIYHLLSGSTVERSYNMNSAMSTDLVEAVLLSDEYAQIKSRQMETTAYYSNDDSSYNTAWLLGESEIDYLKKHFDHATVAISDKCGINSETIKVSQEAIKAISDAYYQDLSNMTVESLENSDTACFIFESFVLDSFTNTINALENAGITIPEITDEYIQDYSANRNYNRTFGYNYPVNYMTDLNYCFVDENYYEHHQFTDAETYEDHIKRMSKSETVTFIGNDYFSGPGNSINMNAYASDPAFCELLKNSRTMVFDDMPLAVIYIDGQRFFIMDEGNNKQLLDDITGQMY